jgi:hypothetical protein
MKGKAKGMIVYLLIAFGMAWVLWEIPLRFGLSPRSPLFQLAALPGAFAPASGSPARDLRTPDCA